MRALYICCEFIDILRRIVADVRSYDPEFGNWEFGKLSALREIAFALEEGYKYYYMGMPCLACVLLIG